MTIAEKAMMGCPISDCCIVDVHMHNARVANFFSRFDYYADLVRQMDAIGIDSGIVSNLWDTGEIWKTHPEILHMCDQFPGRFYGYLSPNPNTDGFKKELSQYAEYAVFIGIKLHPTVHMKDLLCQEYRYAYDFAAERGFPVLIHTWGIEDLLRFHDLAAEFPRTTLILGHSGGEEAALREAIRVAANHDNVYLDTACSYVWYGAIEAMVRGATAKKVLYGSDAYWNSMEAAVGRIALADISEEEKRLILGENAKRIFHMQA